MKNYTKVAKYCRDLGLGVTKPLEIKTGLCYNLNLEFRGEVRINDTLDFSRYPNYSGDIDYPVPSLEGLSPKVMYGQARQWQGAYGDERRKFCLWVADEIERLIKNGELL